MRKARLIFVSSDNHNKFYNMDELDNGTFSVLYGRVDVTEQRVQYPINLWDKKYKEKIRKGYTDVTEFQLDKVAPTEEVDFTTNDPTVQSFVNDLLNYAKNTIAQNYKISAAQVTKQQIIKAQNIINELLNINDLNIFNNKLLLLYSIIPRKMYEVKYHLLNKIEERDRLIIKEQDLLDTLESQCNLQTSDTNILKANNLEIKAVQDNNIINIIKNLLGNNSHQFDKAYEVINNKTAKSFNDFKINLEKPNIKLLWHGSRNENWWSIVTTGLLIRPSNVVYTGSMFGDGIYFADKAQKSIGYTSYKNSYWARGSESKAYLALYEVCLGNSRVEEKHQYSFYKLNYETLNKDGYHSFFAKGGADLKNNEYIVYKPSQTTIKYMVQIK